MLDAHEENFVSMFECYESYSIPDCVVNIKESMDKLKSSGLNGHWDMLWPKAIIDGLRSPNQQDEIQNILVLGGPSSRSRIPTFG
jgi:hypothetical protein